MEQGLTVRKISKASGILTTIAGTGARGYSGDGGLATAATFNGIAAMVFDKAGNLFVTDVQNHAVRKISAATGIITTIAGRGTAGYSGDGGPATAATMNNPYGISIDRSGNIYIADNLNNVIRRVDATTGIISTVAGTGARGYGGDDGHATSARLNHPNGLATDTAGNVYIADEFNNRVRKISMATGKITTVAGIHYGGYNGDSIAAANAALYQPFDLCMDTAGNLCIADRTFRIRKITYDTVPPVVDDPDPVTDSNVIVTKTYPNPAHGTVTVALKGLINGSIGVTVTDMYGKPVAIEQVTIQPTMNYTTTLPLPTSLQKGLYYVTIYVNKNKQVHALMIQ